MTIGLAAILPNLSSGLESTGFLFGAGSSVEPGFGGSAQARALEAFGHRWEANPEEIGAANALVFNPDGTVTAVSEGKRHGVGTALVQRRGH